MYANAQGNILPHDITKFVERRDVCDHFRGEPYEGDAERRDFIERQLNEYCNGTDAELMS